MELPPYEFPLSTATGEPGLQELQRRLDQHTDPDTLEGILKSVDGNIEDAVTILREAGIKVKADPLPAAPIPVRNVPCRAQPGDVRAGSPPAQNAARQTRRGRSASGSPAPGSPLSGSPAHRGPLRQAAQDSSSGVRQRAVVRHAVGRLDDETRELATKEYVWWWNPARGIWVQASIECHNARQLAVEYTVRLYNGQLIDSPRRLLRPRFAADPVPPPPLQTGNISPRATMLTPLRRGLTDAPSVVADHNVASHDSSPASSSPIIIEPDGSTSRGKNGARMEGEAVACGRAHTPTSHLVASPAQPQVETWEFIDPTEHSTLRAAREAQEEQDRNLALKLAAEMPPDAAALPDSDDDDDNIGLLNGEVQARATQKLYDRLNQPVKELMEQIKDRRFQRDEATAARNEHVRGQLTFEVCCWNAYRSPVTHFMSWPDSGFSGVAPSAAVCFRTVIHTSRSTFPWFSTYCRLCIAQWLPSIDGML